ncbi:helix-turn-helix domain-containing protein [Methylosinus sporium]|uniref:XRE family transcriptional regulator n=1 Tax=Methylosinus sporium TaxID=428 RepID=A0A2U1STB0_METSR|nr:helix-turn-helix transcriptional regulator [Methylosinus sporium]PWB94844.1 XRE family transcriptional regulator [Methylosinus sporium]
MPSKPKPLQEIVAENVRRERTSLGISQEEFAARCGYHRTYIGAIERAERNITLSTLEALAAALKLDIKELLVRHD